MLKETTCEVTGLRKRTIPSSPKYMLREDGEVYSTIRNKWLTKRRHNNRLNGSYIINLRGKMRIVGHLMLETFHGVKINTKKRQTLEHLHGTGTDAIYSVSILERDENTRAATKGKPQPRRPVRAVIGTAPDGTEHTFASGRKATRHLGLGIDNRPVRRVLSNLQHTVHGWSFRYA